MKKARRKCNEDIAGSFPVRDIEQSRVCAALAYLIFFIPIVIFPEDRFGRYHANQSLLLLLLSTIGVTVLTCIPYYIGMALAAILLAFCLVCGIRGFVLALSRKAKRIPLLGNIALIEFEPKV